MNLTNKDNILEVVTESGLTEKIYVLKFIKIKSKGKKYILYKKMNNNLIFSSEVIDNGEFYKLEEIYDNDVLKIIQEYMKEEII